MENYYIASISGGKDSTAMLLRLLDEGAQLDEAVFYDTGMEFGAIYGVVERMASLCSDAGVRFTTLKPDRPFLVDMLLKPVRPGSESEHYGYDWCGGCARWGTSGKRTAFQKRASAIDANVIQYVGIASDERDRLRDDPGKRYPLAEWGMSEADCLRYCRERGVTWMEEGVDLYDILDRVSCWCCANKNIGELRNIRRHLPGYWGLLKGLQSRIDRPFRRDGATVFDLEERFSEEDRQLTLF